MGAGASIQELQEPQERLTLGRFFSSAEPYIFEVTHECLKYGEVSTPITWVGPFAFSAIMDGQESIWVYNTEREGYHQLYDGRSHAVTQAFHGPYFFAKHEEERQMEIPRWDTYTKLPNMMGYYGGLSIVEREGEEICILPDDTEAIVRWVNPHCFTTEVTPDDVHMFLYVSSVDAYLHFGNWDHCVTDVRQNNTRVLSRVESPEVVDPHEPAHIEGSFESMNLKEVAEVHPHRMMLRGEDVHIEWLNPFTLITVAHGEQEMWVYSASPQGFYQLGNWEGTVSQALSERRLFLAKEIRVPETLALMPPQAGNFRGLTVEAKGELSTATLAPYGSISIAWLNPCAFYMDPPDGNRTIWVYSTDMGAYLQIGEGPRAMAELAENPERSRERLI